MSGRGHGVDGGGTHLLFDFGGAQSVQGWAPIDDGVMGGVSRSAVAQRGGALRFSGEVSLDRGGGFASIRSAPLDADLRGTAGLALRLRGDGRRYKLNLKTARGFDTLQYQARLDPPAGRWTELHLPYGSFRAVFRGRPRPDAPALDLRCVRTVGLLIADRQAGPFALEIAWIGAYGEPD